MKYLLLNVIFLSLYSCTTVEFVRKETTPEKKAVVKHSITSDEKKAAKYKDEVNKKATEFCGNSNFTITKEYEALEPAQSTVGVGTGFGYSNTSLLIGSAVPSQTMASFVEFTCKQ